MQRWRTNLFIAVYLGVLGFGLAAHALTFLKTCHPAMYFIVWDMFCGWSAYETRCEVIGEGDSGTYYQLAPGPWGEIRPFGSAERRDYDAYGQFGHRLAANTLRHTVHEPIRRIYIVEKAWAKKYNLPAPLWELRYRTPKPAEFPCYYHLRAIYNEQGVCLHRVDDWLKTQYELCVLDNPRLRSDMRKGHTFFASQPRDRQSDRIEDRIETVGYEAADTE